MQATPMGQLRKPSRLVGLLLLVTSLSVNGVHAQSDKPSQHNRTVIVVSSSAGDARLGLVDEAVSFWNMTLQEIGAVAVDTLCAPSLIFGKRWYKYIQPREG
jgi:hypothetical protein